MARFGDRAEATDQGAVDGALGGWARRFALGRAVASFIVVAVPVATPAQAWGAPRPDPSPKAAAAREDGPPRSVDLGFRQVPADPEAHAPAGSGQQEVYVTFADRPPGVLEDHPAVEFAQPIGAESYLAVGSSAALERLRDEPSFVGFADVRPEDKLSQAVRAGELSHQERATVVVRFYRSTSFEAARDLVTSVAGTVLGEGGYLFDNRLDVDVPASGIGALGASALVAAVSEPPPPPAVDNANAALASNVGVARTTFGLTGAGSRIGIWDGGPVRSDHVELSPRVLIQQNALPVSDHATHVTGTMVASGVDANAKGMAPAAGPVYSYDFNGSVTTEMAAARTSFAIDVSNNSWGSVLGWDFDSDLPGWVNTGHANLFGAYDDESRTWDQLVASSGLVIVKSAGNDHGDCNPNNSNDCDGQLGADGQRYDLLGPTGGAKNVITVGSTLDNGTQLSGFSSLGPTDDGRIKPDVVANGQSLFSSWGTSSSAYAAISGTSMATPVVSGVVALLTEQYRAVNGGVSPPQDVIKAVLVNSALDRGRPGPDYQYGFGLVDALRAAQHIAAGTGRLIDDEVEQGQADAWFLQVPAGAPELKATLNWVDPPGLASSPTKDVVNDLDLRLISPTGTVHFPFSGPGAAYATNATATGPNTVDNVEQVVVSAPAAGLWRLEVAGTTVTDADDRQDFAVATSAPIVSPPNDAFVDAVTLDLAGASVVSATGRASVEATELAKPAMCGLGGGQIVRSLWYRINPGWAADVTLNAAGSTFDTVVGVWRGTSLGALTPVACNDDALGTAQSLVSFATTPGQTYYVQAGAYFLGGPTPEGRLNLSLTSKPTNDAFATAAPLAGATGSASGSNVGATKQAGEPNHGLPPDDGGASVWWTWTAPASGFATFHTVGSANTDTLLSIYTGASVDALTLVAGDDDLSGTNRRSSATFKATAGALYRIAVDGYNPGATPFTGGISLSWSLVPGGGGTETYAAVAPCAAYDSRSGTAGFAGPHEVGEVRNIKITETLPAAQGGLTACGVPAAATAVLVNVVALDAAEEGNVRAYAAGGAPPNGGVLNFAPLTGQKLNTANAVAVPLSADGQLAVSVTCGTATCLASPTTEVTQIRVVVLGYYTEGLAARVAALEALVVEPAPGATDERQLAYTAVAPCAAYDSRTGTDDFDGPHEAGEGRNIQITDAVPASQGGETACDVPPGANAAFVNIVAINATQEGNVRAYAAGGAPPNGGVLNFAPLTGQKLNTANAVAVPLSDDGRLAVSVTCGTATCLATPSTEVTQVRVVVLGYFTDGLAARVAALEALVVEPAPGATDKTQLTYAAVEPCAAYDSRTGTGGFAGPHQAGQTRNIQISGSVPAAQGGEDACGVPLGATAVFANIVAVNAAQEGTVRAHPPGGVPPTDAVVNFAQLTGQKLNTANAVAVPLAAPGTLAISVTCATATCLATPSTEVTHVRVVVLGYYTDGLAARIAALEAVLNA